MTGPAAKAVSRSIALALLAVLVLAPAAARAQTWRGLELERSIREAAWHFGPFAVQPSLVIANAGIDTNIYYSTNEPIRDFTLTAGPAATVYLPLGRKLVLSAAGSPQYVWYSKTERERSWNYYLSGAVQLNLRNAFFSLDGIYSDARERWNTEIDIRPRRKEEGLGGSVLLRVAWKTSFALGYRTVRYNYESVEFGEGLNVRERLNRLEQYATFSAYYQASANRRFFLDLEYGRFDFEFAPQAALRDGQSGAVLGGVDFAQLGSRVRGRLRLGYRMFDVRNPNSPDYSGFVGDTQLSVRLARMFTVRGSYLRDVRFSLWYGDAYYIETRPSAGASVYLLSFLRLDYDYSWGQNRYPVAGEGAVARLDRYDIHTTGLYVRIVKNTALGFVVSWWQRDSNVYGEDDQRMFYGLNLTYDF